MLSSLLATYVTKSKEFLFFLNPAVCYPFGYFTWKPPSRISFAIKFVHAQLENWIDARVKVEPHASGNRELTHRPRAGRIMDKLADEKPRYAALPPTWPANRRQTTPFVDRGSVCRARWSIWMATADRGNDPNQISIPNFDRSFGLGFVCLFGAGADLFSWLCFFDLQMEAITIVVQTGGSINRESDTKGNKIEVGGKHARNWWFHWTERLRHLFFIKKRFTALTAPTEMRRVAMISLTIRKFNDQNIIDFSFNYQTCITLALPLWTVRKYIKSFQRQRERERKRERQRNKID